MLSETSPIFCYYNMAIILIVTTLLAPCIILVKKCSVSLMSTTTECCNCKDATKAVTIFSIGNKMIAVESERKWRFVVLFLIIVLEMHTCMSVCAAVNSTESGILRWIIRRQSFDIYNFINSSSTDRGINCDNERSTYLISDKQCEKEQELLSGISLSIIVESTMKI